MIWRNPSFTSRSATKLLISSPRSPAASTKAHFQHHQGVPQPPCRNPPLIPCAVPQGLVKSCGPLLAPAPAKHQRRQHGDQQRERSTAYSPNHRFRRIIFCGISVPGTSARPTQQRAYRAPRPQQQLSPEAAGLTPRRPQRRTDRKLFFPRGAARATGCARFRSDQQNTPRRSTI